MGRPNWEHFPASVYRDREERNRFVGAQFAGDLGGTVLNIGGGGKKHLVRWLPPGAKYLEIDIAGEPDQLVDLERELPLPFGDQSFDTVVCTDVLEHVDNLHAVFAEGCRVAKDSVIISLPNAWATLRGDMFRGTGQSGKFYGLPLQKPEDRHKWFFSFTDAEAFLETASREQGFAPARWLSCGFVHPKAVQRVARNFTSAIFGTRGRFNLFATTIWVQLRRDPNRTMR